MNPSEVAGVKVLIVDDASSVRSLLNNVLIAEGYEVVGQLPSGMNLLETIVKTKPDLVCLDYYLPGTNGIELLRQVHAAHPDVSIVMITGNADGNLEDIAADAGAEGFISKPFSLSKLTQDLRQVVQARRLLASMRHSPPPSTLKAPRATAVIADDSATMRFLLTSILTAADIKVLGAAGDGKEAVEMVIANAPDIVFLDCEMPVLNGLDALRTIRNQAPKSKVVMITGRSDRETIIQANNSGANGYILKPFHPHKVMSTIDKLLM